MNEFEIAFIDSIINMCSEVRNCNECILLNKCDMLCGRNCPDGMEREELAKVIREEVEE